MRSLQVGFGGVLGLSRYRWMEAKAPRHKNQNIKKVLVFVSWPFEPMLAPTHSRESWGDLKKCWLFRSGVSGLRAYDGKAYALYPEPGGLSCRQSQAGLDAGSCFHGV